MALQYFHSWAWKECRVDVKNTRLPPAGPRPPIQHLFLHQKLWPIRLNWVYCIFLIQSVQPNRSLAVNAAKNVGLDSMRAGGLQKNILVALQKKSSETSSQPYLQNNLWPAFKKFVFFLPASCSSSCSSFFPLLCSVDKTDKIFTCIAPGDPPWTRCRKSGGRMLSSIRFSWSRVAEVGPWLLTTLEAGKDREKHGL